MAERQLFAIDGLWCGGCARGLERRLREHPGVEQVAVHFLTASALIQWDPALTDRGAIGGLISDAGYGLIEHPQPQAMLQRLQQTMHVLALRLAVALFFGMWSMAAGVALYSGSVHGDAAWWLAMASGAFAAPVVLWAGRDILRMAWRSLMLRNPGIDLLITVGVAGCLVLSVWHLLLGRSHVYFDSAAMLITLLLVGRLVEAWVRRRALDAIVAMQAADSETALVLDAAGNVHPTALARIEIGSRVLVQAGSVAAIDGVIVQGNSQVDRAVLSGESIPQPIAAGDRISAGSLNLDAALMVTSDRAAGDRDIDRMGGRIALELVARQPHTDRQTAIAESLARWIPLLALAVACASLLAGLGVATAVLRALAVLVAACPCALAVATPLAHLRVAIQASRRGLRIADPASLDALAKARTAIFDKTGTLTTGNPQLLQIRPTGRYTPADVLAAAACAEAGIDHPLAIAINRAAAQAVAATGVDSTSCIENKIEAPLPSREWGWGEGVPQPDIDLAAAMNPRAASAPPRFIQPNSKHESEAPLPPRERGRGEGAPFSTTDTATTFSGRREPRAASGIWQGCMVRVSAAEHPPADASHLTWLEVTTSDTTLGLLGIGDSIDPDAAVVLARLRADGLQLHLASGDAEGPVHAIAAQLGIENAHAGMTPAQKADLIRQSDGPVLFVGDGVNDAPAMAAADCGISVQSAHPATHATAAVGILQGGLAGIVEARRLAMWSGKLIRRNLAAALVYNIAILPLAMLGLLTPLGAALAMTASSLSQIALVLCSRAPRCGEIDATIRTTKATLRINEAA